MQRLIFKRAQQSWGIRIHRNHGNVANGLIGYGTHHRSYANSLLKCEDCLITHGQAKARTNARPRTALSLFILLPNPNLILDRTRASPRGQHHETFL